MKIGEQGGESGESNPLLLPAADVNRTLWGTKLDGTGVPVSLQGADGGVRASLFYAGQPGFK